MFSTKKILLLKFFVVLAVMSICVGSLVAGKQMTVEMKGLATNLYSPSGIQFHSTKATVAHARVLPVAGSTVQVMLWEEIDSLEKSKPFYAVDFGDGRVSSAREAVYDLRLRFGTFDPLVGVPDASPLRVDSESINLYIVQFITQPLEVYRNQILALGGAIHKFLPHQAYIVKLAPEQVAGVAALPFVRWIGSYEPAYRLEEFLLDNRERADAVYPLQKYNLLTFEHTAESKSNLAQTIAALGGQVDNPDAGKFLMEVTLTPQQLFRVANLDMVAFIDRWGPVEEDMNIAREISGANAMETLEGFTGQGVRAEIYDSGFNVTHVDFASRPLILHTASVSAGSHGAATSGINFGDGTGNAMARGMMPDGQGIIADSAFVGNRYNHTGQLLGDPYYAVFQTSSVGNPRTTLYTTLSSSHDTILFDHDILLCQSQSNAGSRDSRPESWAKNVVSVGGIVHFDTLTRADDCWGCDGVGGSIGPAIDGRIKPDLAHFYDRTIAPSQPGTNTYQAFGGTSGATPITCGSFGLFFQMWSEGLFGAPLDGGNTIFDNRPHATTAKAMMINGAFQYDFDGGTHDLARVHQGWGMADLNNMYQLRDQFFIVDEADIITNLETLVYSVQVDPGEAVFKATLVFSDPAGLPASTINRINDLSLRVTSPSGLAYWGNFGLYDHPFSVSGGIANSVDTVENVFVANPESGVWTIEVIAHEINEDGHVETGGLDADFALVVSPVQELNPALEILVPEGVPSKLEPNLATDFEVEIRAGTQSLVGGSAMLHYRAQSVDGNGFNSTPLTSNGGGSFTATLPVTACGQVAEFYISAMGSGGATVNYPAKAPAVWLTATVGTETEIFADDFETVQGWTVGAGDDTATTGIWTRVDPEGTSAQPETDHTPGAATMTFVTGQGSVGGTNGENDVDGGKTTLLSPVFDLSGTDPIISYWRWYSNNTSVVDDPFIIDISSNGGTNWVNVETLGPAGAGTTGGWIYHEFKVSDFVTPTDQIRMRFVATDIGGGSIVEAALDDFRIFEPQCGFVCVAGVLETLFPNWPGMNVRNLIQWVCD